MQHRLLLAKYPIISDQISQPALAVVLRELEAVLTQPVTGSIVEFGCYIGTTSLFMRRLLNVLDPTRALYAYDSFQGLPGKTSADSSAVGNAFQAGELSVSKRQFLETFKKAGLEPPITYKAWFSDIQPCQLPEQIAYAFLDGDFYESIMDSLKLVWPRLAKDGVITIDDYDREALPGVSKAVEHFFSDKAVNVHHEQHIAVIKCV